jgi:hypothetical protein
MPHPKETFKKWRLIHEKIRAVTSMALLKRAIDVSRMRKLELSKVGYVAYLVFVVVRLCYNTS